jgi:hypothetical protein
VRIFISYRRGEMTSAIAGRLDDRLRLRFGQDQVFRDVDNIPSGVDFHHYIEDAVRACDVFLALIDREFFNERIRAEADFVRLEVEAALEQRKFLIPVLIRGTKLPKASKLPRTVAPMLRLQCAELDVDRGFDGDIRRLIRDIERGPTLQPRRDLQPAKAPGPLQLDDRTQAVADRDILQTQATVPVVPVPPVPSLLLAAREQVKTRLPLFLAVMAVAVLSAIGFLALPRTGELHLVITPPDAQVSCNGEPVAAPSGVISRPVGPCRLRVERPGYVPVETAVEILRAPGRPLSIRLAPSPETRLELTSIPSGQLVWIDGKPALLGPAGKEQARTPLVQGVEVGTHRIAISGDPAFQPYQRDFVQEPDLPTKLHAQLVAVAVAPQEPEKPAAPAREPEPPVRVAKAPKPGPTVREYWLTISSNPVGADILVAGAPKGQTPLSLRLDNGAVNLPILLRKTGFEDRSVTIRPEDWRDGPSGSNTRRHSVQVNLEPYKPRVPKKL